ncbi:MAG TPA: protein adenylyltransferase SelO [Verrucomicrobiae bacterium]|nr:protein adenylyltransferase SelO [Verrucomicrobiae bacterium]
MKRALDELLPDSLLPGLGTNYYSTVPTTPVSEPHLVAFNPDAAALIDLDPAQARDARFIEVMAGNAPMPHGESVAMLYAGHQFGVFVPQLGDGRAITVGEVKNARGEHWELQLKGAGKTPYSRFGDGRAVLRSTIREYLCGEAMHGLGIPTTRSLCIVGSPLPVQRETMETAAVLCRMAPSHVRFGSFEVFYYRGEHGRLAPLADHVIRNHFPDIGARAPPTEAPLPPARETRPYTKEASTESLPAERSVGGPLGPTDYAAWLKEVIERTARLMAQWQSVGFCHGVMNTDNFSILGLTLDYGPYGFMEQFEPGWICNHTDEGGRYSYENQPGIGHWNCSKLLQATLPLLDDKPEAAVEKAYALLEAYGPAFTAENVARWRAKLGLREPRDSDPDLVNRLLDVMARSKADFTTVFRLLKNPAAVRDHMLDLECYDAWLADYRARLAHENSDDAGRAARMDAANPKYVLRNHLAQAAIEKAQVGDFGEIEVLRALLARPFDEQPGYEAYTQPGTQKIEVSCSS